MRVLVTGGRDYQNFRKVEQALNRYHRLYGITEIVEGGARGADSLARQWARQNNVRVRTFPADWKKYGRSAGPIRNRQMLTEARPHRVVVFPGGRGTAHMARTARDHGILVHYVTDVSN